MEDRISLYTTYAFISLLMIGITFHYLGYRKPIYYICGTNEIAYFKKGYFSDGAERAHWLKVNRKVLTCKAAKLKFGNPEVMPKVNPQL